MSASPDLSMIATSELIGELFKRHDSVLVMLDRQHTSRVDEIVMHYSGGLARCLGLSCVARDRLLAVDREAERAG